MAVVPSLLNGGFVVGGRYGKGVASCRTEKGWSAPAFFVIGGGSFGLQIGGQATDLVMLIMNKNGMDNLLSSQFKLGADASAAAGPVGRHASADTDWKMRAEVLTYSRSRGLFAGLELAGAVIKQDKDSTREFYGRMVPFTTSLKGEIEAPQTAYPFLSTLAKWAQAGRKVVSSRSSRYLSGRLRLVPRVKASPSQQLLTHPPCVTIPRPLNSAQCENASSTL